MLFEKTKHLAEGLYNSILEAVTPAEQMLKLDKDKLEEKKHEIDEQIIRAKADRNKLNSILGQYAITIDQADKAANIELQKGNDSQATTFLKQKNQALENYTITKNRLTQMDKSIQDLINASKQAKLSIDEQQAKIDQMIVDSQISSAELTIAESIHNVGKNAMDLGRDIKRIQDKSNNQTSRASAIRDLANSNTIDTDETKTIQNTLIEDNITKELAKKKSKMIKLPEEKIYSAEDFKS